MGYKILGFAVWKGARWYVRRRTSRLVPSRRVLAGALVVSAVGVIAVAASSRQRCSES